MLGRRPDVSARKEIGNSGGQDGGETGIGNENEGAWRLIFLRFTGEKGLFLRLFEVFLLLRMTGLLGLLGLADIIYVLISIIDG